MSCVTKVTVHPRTTPELCGKKQIDVPKKRCQYEILEKQCVYNLRDVSRRRRRLFVLPFCRLFQWDVCHYVQPLDQHFVWLDDGWTAAEYISKRKGGRAWVERVAFFGSDATTPTSYKNHHYEHRKNHQKQPWNRH